MPMPGTLILADARIQQTSETRHARDCISTSAKRFHLYKDENQKQNETTNIAKYRRIRTKRCRILIEGKAEERALPFGNVSDDNEAIDHKEKLFCPKYKVFGYSIIFRKLID